MAVTPSLRQATAIGSNTPTSLLAGAVGGLVAEIQGRWAALRQEVPNLGLILTGGDADTWNSVTSARKSPTLI